MRSNNKEYINTYKKIQNKYTNTYFSQYMLILFTIDCNNKFHKK